MGLENPSTLTSLSNLGSLYKQMGDLKTAQSYMEKCLKLSEKVIKNLIFMLFYLFEYFVIF